MLTSLLAQHNTEAEPVSMDDLDIAQELRRIEAAQGIADGMEDRLDGLIGNLDKLLESLQAPGDGPATSKPQSSGKPSPSEKVAPSK